MTSTQAENPPDPQEATDNEYRKELWSGLKSAHEHYDKALLTLSSGGLALSVTLIKDMFPLEKVVWSWLLMTSWFLFTGAIVAIIISFLVSQQAFVVQLENFEEVVADTTGSVTTRNNFIAPIIWLNRASGILFFSAVIAITTFSAINFSKRCDDVRRTGGAKVQGSSTTANPTQTTYTSCTCPAARTKSGTGTSTPSAPNRPAKPVEKKTH